MKTPAFVQRAMKAMGMKKGDTVEKVVAENKAMLKKENDAINNFNKKVYENKKNNLEKVANIVKKHENMKRKKKLNRN
jgi:bifunctional DNA-binding transcriptional regulator/antitoxin component of YhaV-PrlF toxin-antitoxin module